jgi:hypothetical protein
MIQQGVGKGVNGIPILQDYRILVLKQFTNQSSLIKTVIVIVVEEHIQVKVIIQERHIAIKHQGIVRQKVIGLQVEDVLVPINLHESSFFFLTSPYIRVLIIARFKRIGHHVGFTVLAR